MLVQAECQPDNSVCGQAGYLVGGHLLARVMYTLVSRSTGAFVADVEEHACLCTTPTVPAGRFLMLCLEQTPQNGGDWDFPPLLGSLLCDAQAG